MAFIRWDINPANWSADDRGMYVYTTSFIGVFLIWFSELLNPEKSV